MNRILSFSLFEGEAKNNSSWDSDYDSLDVNPLWKELQNRGFVNEPSPIMAKNKTLHLRNPKSPWFYPAGVVLQKSGYIRDKAAKSGFVRNDLITIDDMLSYLIERYDKELKKMSGILSSLEGSNLSQEHIKLISAGTRSKWAYDKSTGKIDVNGKIQLRIGSQRDKELLADIKFGKIKSDFTISFAEGTFGVGEVGDFSYAPDYVGSDFIALNARLKDLEGLGEVKNRIVIRGKNYWKGFSLENIQDCEELWIGDFFAIPYDVQHCLLVLENGCLEKVYGQGGSEFIKSDYATQEEDDVAREIILTAPIMDKDSLLEYFRENPMSIDILESPSPRIKEVKDFIFTSLGYTDRDLLAIKRQKNRLL